MWRTRRWFIYRTGYEQSLVFFKVVFRKAPRIRNVGTDSFVSPPKFKCAYRRYTQDADASQMISPDE